jgi:phosphoribosyl 1,2-cyclic phosphodiesterase
MVRFWGVRGSIPSPGPQTVAYGGNTPCIEFRLEDPDRLIIIDAGSGIRELGNYMMGHDLPKGPLRADIFLTHTHWDHIMGFPFFTPIYIPGANLTVYGPTTYEDDTLRDVMSGQQTYRHFPIRQSELASTIEYVDLKEEHIDLGNGLTVTSKFLNHPVSCLGYRFEFQGKVFCTGYDTEPFRNLFCTDPEDPTYDEAMALEGDMVAEEANRDIENFFAGADLLVHDCQYTRDEYTASKIGWGHSAVDDAIGAGKRAGVKRLALFHHEPVRTDKQIQELEQTHCSPEANKDVEIFFAREGMTLTL